MKRIIICALLASLLLSICSCNLIADKLGEKIGEGLIENILGEGVDIDGNSYTVTDENGDKWIYSSDSWPTGELAALLPKLNCTVTYSVSSKNYCSLTAEGVSLDDYNYFKSNLTIGVFTNVTQDSENDNPDSSDKYFYASSVSGDKTVYVTYNGNDMSVVLTAGGETSEAE